MLSAPEAREARVAIESKGKDERHGRIDQCGEDWDWDMDEEDDDNESAAYPDDDGDVATPQANQSFLAPVVWERPSEGVNIYCYNPDLSVVWLLEIVLWTDVCGRIWITS